VQYEHPLLEQICRTPQVMIIRKQCRAAAGAGRLHAGWDGRVTELKQERNQQRWQQELFVEGGN
jgi:hypothetical protein